MINLNTKYANHINGENFLHANYGHRISNLAERIAYDKSKLKWNLELIDLLKSTPYNIIIRPHPEENAEYYRRERYINEKTIFTIYDDNVIPWIMACDYMIHNDCTTAIECALLGKTLSLTIKILIKIYLHLTP